MKLGIVGLGRMGAAISRRLRQQGFDVTGWDQNAKANQALAADGLCIAANARGARLIKSSAFFESRRSDHFGIGRRPALPQIHKIRLLCWIMLLEMPAEKCV